MDINVGESVLMLGLAVFLVLLNGFFVLSEFSVVKIRRSRLEELVKAGRPNAKLALDMFRYQIAKFIGSYVVALGGCDAIVFTAGIGENNGGHRAAICEYLSFLGLEVDAEKNKLRGSNIEFSTANSKVKAFIIPTDEELMIAQDTMELLK